MAHSVAACRRPHTLSLKLPVVHAHSPAGGRYGAKRSPYRTRKRVAEGGGLGNGIGVFRGILFCAEARYGEKNASLPKHLQCCWGHPCDTKPFRFRNWRPCSHGAGVENRGYI